MPLQGINVTLFGRIDSISENVSILLFINFLSELLIQNLLFKCKQEYNGCSIDMYVIKISDKTGKNNKLNSKFKL